MNLEACEVVQFVLYDKHRAKGCSYIVAKLVKKELIDLVLLLEGILMQIVKHHAHELFATLFVAKPPHHYVHLGQTYHHYFVVQQMFHLRVSGQVGVL